MELVFLSCKKNSIYFIMNKIKVSTIGLLSCLIFQQCSDASKETNNSFYQKEITMKKNIGSKLALYPTPLVVVGANVNGAANWLLVGHVGIVGHDRILISMSKSHYTNQGIKEHGVFSVNVVNEDLLPLADYVGSVSGNATDKSHVFNYHLGECGAPIIDKSPLVMECRVEDNYETEGFDNFICSIANTYADESILSSGKIDYNVFKPILFEFPSYMYLRTGDVVGKCLKLKNENITCAKLPQTANSIVRLSKIEVYPNRLAEYQTYATEVGEISMRTEPGVIFMYGMAEKENPCKITILEIYADTASYQSHIQSSHFQKYKIGTKDMVKSLELIDNTPLNADMIPHLSMKIE